jgi:hypothetical protein
VDSLPPPDEAGPVVDRSPRYRCDWLIAVGSVIPVIGVAELRPVGVARITRERSAAEEHPLAMVFERARVSLHRLRGRVRDGGPDASGQARGADSRDSAQDAENARGGRWKGPVDARRRVLR